MSAGSPVDPQSVWHCRDPLPKADHRAGPRRDHPLDIARSIGHPLHNNSTQMTSLSPPSPAKPCQAMPSPPARPGQGGASHWSLHDFVHFSTVPVAQAAAPSLLVLGWVVATGASAGAFSPTQPPWFGLGTGTRYWRRPARSVQYFMDSASISRCAGTELG